MAQPVDRSSPDRQSPADVQAFLARAELPRSELEQRSISADRARDATAAPGRTDPPPLEGQGARVNLADEARRAEETAIQMEQYLEAFYSGRITAGMLASNPALQLWVQQALQWENRYVTAMSNLLREVHETRKAVLNNLRA